jgi:hypothetical protein
MEACCRRESRVEGRGRGGGRSRRALNRGGARFHSQAARGRARRERRRAWLLYPCVRQPSSSRHAMYGPYPAGHSRLLNSRTPYHSPAATPQRRSAPEPSHPHAGGAVIPTTASRLAPSNKHQPSAEASSSTLPSGGSSVSPLTPTPAEAKQGRRSTALRLLELRTEYDRLSPQQREMFGPLPPRTSSCAFALPQVVLIL